MGSGDEEGTMVIFTPHPTPTHLALQFVMRTKKTKKTKGYND